MFLSRLYRYVIDTYQDLDVSIYESIYPTLRPLALKPTRRPRSDKGKSRRHSYHGSSSQQEDDDEIEEDAPWASTSPFTTYEENLQDIVFPESQTPSPPPTTERLHATQKEILHGQRSMHKEMQAGFKAIGKTIKGIFGKKKK